MEVSLLFQRYKLVSKFVRWYLYQEQADYTSTVWIQWIGLVNTLLDAIRWSSQAKAKRLYKTCLAILKDVLLQHLTGMNRIRIVLDTVFAKGYDSEHPRQTLLIGPCLEYGLYLDNSGKSLEKYQESTMQVVSKLLGSKTRVASWYVDALAPFYRHLMTKELVNNHVFAHIDRLLLRSPEVVLSFVAGLVEQSSLDYSDVLLGKLSDSLLNQFKSKSDDIKQDALRLYQALMAKSDESSLEQVVQVILNGLTSKSPTPDQRVYFYRAIASIKPFVNGSTQVVQKLVGLLLKESSEPVLMSGANALGVHAKMVLSAGEDQASLKLLLSGLNDSKSLMRIASLQALLLACDETVQTNLDELVQVLIKITQDVQAAGITILDPKKDTRTYVEGVYASLILVKLICWGKTTLIEPLLSADGFLFNEKLYAKLLVKPDEQQMYADLLMLCFSTPLLLERILSEFDVGLNNALSKAMAWVWVGVDATVRRNIAQSQSLLILKDQSVLKPLISLARTGLGTMIKEVYESQSTDKSLFSGETPGRSSKDIAQRVVVIIQSLLPNSLQDHLLVTEALLELYIVCVHPLMVKHHGNDLWIRLVFRSELTPTILTLAQDRINQWLSTTTQDETLGGLNPCFSPGFRQATLTGLGLASAIVPGSIIKPFLFKALELIQSTPYEEVSPSDIAIWKTPADQLYLDPLNVKSTPTSSKTRLTEEEKWELELKQKLAAQKKTPQTKQEKEMVNERFKFEQNTRQRVSLLKQNMDLGLDLLDALISAILSDAMKSGLDYLAVYLNEIIETLLHFAIKNEFVEHEREPAGQLGGLRLVHVFLKLAQVCLPPELDIQAVSHTLLIALGVNTSEVIPEKYLNQSPQSNPYSCRSYS